MRRCKHEKCCTHRHSRTPLQIMEDDVVVDGVHGRRNILNENGQIAKNSVISTYVLKKAAAEARLASLNVQRAKQRPL